MANKDFYFGLRPVKHLNGNPWNGVTQKCTILTTVSNAIGIGDPVLFAGGADARGNPTVDLATLSATNKISGVITGFEADPDNLHPNYRTSGAKSKDRICYVCIDPDVIFHIQDDDSFALTEAYTGFNAALIRSHSTNTLTGVSAVELDASTPSGDATEQLYILRLADIEDNAFGINAIWEVLINKHSLNRAITGA